MLGAAVEFVGIIMLAAASGVNWGGRNAFLGGGIAIAIGAVLQVSAILQPRR